MIAPLFLVGLPALAGLALIVLWESTEGRADRRARRIVAEAAAGKHGPRARRIARGH